MRLLPAGLQSDRHDNLFALHLRWGGLLVAVCIPLFHWLTAPDQPPPRDLSARMGVGLAGLAAFGLSFPKKLRPYTRTLWLLLVTGLLAGGTLVALRAPVSSPIFFAQALYLIPLHLVAQSVAEDLWIGLAPLALAGAEFLFGRPAPALLPTLVFYAALAALGFGVFRFISGFRSLSYRRQEQLARERRRLAVLRESAERLLGADAAADVFAELAQTSKDLLDADDASVLVRHGETWRWAGEPETTPGIPASVLSLPGRVVETGRPVTAGPDAPEGLGAAVPGPVKEGTVLLLPLRTRDEAAADGVLVIRSRDGRRFDEAEVAVAQLLARQVGAALASIAHAREARARAEEALRQQNFRAAVEDSIADALSVVSVEGELIHVNETLCRMTGFSRDELIGRRLPFPYWAPEEQDRIERSVRAVIEANEEVPRRRRETFRRKSGERFPVEVLPSPIRDERGAITAWVGIIRDLSREEERKRRLEALDRAIGVTEEGIAILNGRGRYIQVNRAHEKIYGYEAGELLGQSWKMLYESATSEWLESHCLPVMHQQGRWSGELVGKRKDGTLFAQEVSLAAVSDAAGHYAGLICVCRDITQRKRVEEERHRALKLFERVSEAIEDGIAVLDVPSRGWIYYNSQAERLWSRELMQQPAGEGLDRIARISDPARSARLLRISTDAGYTETSDDLVELADGRVIRRYTMPIELAADGSVSRRLHVYQDLSVRVARERELEAASRLKSEFLANTSHELRTPLNAILGFLQLVLDGLTESPDQQREFLLHARDASSHLLSLIDDILDIARIEADRLNIHCEAVDVESLFAEVEGILAAGTRVKGLHLGFRVCEGGQRVWADPARLRQILWNLVGNAVKFTETGEICVEARCDDRTDRIRFEICDTGVGVPMDKIPALFEKFVQADGSPTRRFGGTGLGLAIAKALVERMGGSIGLEARNGGGTRAWFTLPRDSEAAGLRA
jgi:PAS domain S-box-containing protein